jgi:hypothetical protein
VPGSWSWLPVSVTEFRDGDDGNAAYLAWTAANGHGYVINIQRSLNPSDARLHRAACRWINGTPSRGRGFVGSYIKVCSESVDELGQWAAVHAGSQIRACGTCRPAWTQDRARPSPEVPRTTRPSPQPTPPRTGALGVAPVSAAAMDRLVDACRSLPVRDYGYEQHDYMTNVLLTVLDLQMHNRVVERSTRHYWDQRQEQVRTLDDLGGLLARFPDDQEGNRAVARYLWGNDHWMRVHWLRGFARFLAEEDLRTQQALTEWARRSDYDRDFAGRVKYLGPAAYRWLVMRLGVDTVKPDAHLCRFVERNAGHAVSDAELVRVVTATARRLGQSPRELDAAIWEHERGEAGVV